MATATAFPGFVKTDNRTFTRANVKHQYEVDHKGLSKGFIFAYMDLTKQEQETVERSLRLAIEADSTLCPPSDPVEKSKFKWAPNNRRLCLARFQLQTTILNGDTLWQKQNNKTSPPHWYRREWLYVNNVEDSDFLNTMFQQLLLLILESFRKEGKKAMRAEEQDEYVLARSRSSTTHGMTATTAAPLHSQDTPGRHRANSSVGTPIRSRERHSRRDRSIRRNSVRSAHSSTSLTQDSIDLIPTERTDDISTIDHEAPKKELKSTHLIFVWVDVLDARSGRVKLSGTPPVLFRTFFNDEDKLDRMNKLALFRYSAMMSSTQQPPPPMHQLTAKIYQRYPGTFLSFQLTDNPNIPSHFLDFEKQRVESQTAGIFQKVYEQASNVFEDFQVFVAADPAHLELVPVFELTKDRDIAPERIVSKST